jgi:hypothetical protein
MEPYTFVNRRVCGCFTSKRVNHAEGSSAFSHQTQSAPSLGCPLALGLEMCNIFQGGGCPAASEHLFGVPRDPGQGRDLHHRAHTARSPVPAHSRPRWDEGRGASAPLTAHPHARSSGSGTGSNTYRSVLRPREPLERPFDDERQALLEHSERFAHPARVPCLPRRALLERAGRRSNPSSKSVPTPRQARFNSSNNVSSSVTRAVYPLR